MSDGANAWSISAPHASAPIETPLQDRFVAGEAFDFVGGEFEAADAESRGKMALVGGRHENFDDAFEGLRMIAQAEDDASAEHDAPAGFKCVLAGVEFLSPAPPACIIALGVEVEFTLVEGHGGLEEGIDDGEVVELATVLEVFRVKS